MKNTKRTINDNCLSFIVISDTHSDLHPEINNLVKKDSYVIHAGDVGDINIINNLKNTCKDVFAVNGNNDDYPELSKMETIQTQYGDIVVECTKINNNLVSIPPSLYHLKEKKI